MQALLYLLSGGVGVVLAIHLAINDWNGVGVLFMIGGVVLTVVGY